MKKNIFLLTIPLMLLFSTYLIASPPPDPNDSLRVKLDQVFSPINKTLIPTGFLEEYAYPFIPLDLFNNTLTDSSLTTMNIWRMLYATLYSAKIYGTNTLPRLDTINARLDAATAASLTIPIVMIRLDYSTLRPDAVSANLLRVQNDQLYDVAGRTQSPYVQKTLFAASPARSYSESGTVSFVLQQNFYPQNNDKAVNLLSIDFGDGRGYQSAYWSTPLSTNYTSKGTKRIKVRITYADGETLESHFEMDVRNVACPTCRYGNLIQPREFALNSLHSGGTVFIRYGGNHTQLIKPLIVAEGYDASRIAPDLATNFSINNFLALITPAGAFNFQNALDNIGNYDIVFIDYANGTDDIRRNAALFQEVVAWVNDHKVADAQGVWQQNVVMGISMGGLVARYGLAQMVKAGQNPQTRLLITHDSPHRGANTPLGLQYLTRLTAHLDQVTSFSPTSFFLNQWFQIWQSPRQADYLLDEPATKQMLIVRATNALGGHETNTFLDNEYRSMITFGSTGPQPNYRTIATSLGSQCGIGSLAPASQLVGINGSFFLDPLPWIMRHKTNSEVIINALPPQGQSQRITYLRIWFEYKILSFIKIKVLLVNHSVNSPAGLLPWDGAPGGTQNIRAQAGNRVPNTTYNWAGFFEYSLGSQYAGDFCFVPTVSALDIADVNTTTIQAKYVGGVASSSTARVANFIAQAAFGANPTTYNLTHPNFNARNSQWLFNEMEEAGDRTLHCSTECNSYNGVSISGREPVCSSTTFSISQGQSARWSSSNSAGLSIHPTTGVATRQGSFSGSVTLTALVNNCISLTRTVAVGELVIGTYYTNSSQQYTLYSGNSITAGTTVVTVTPGATSYSWAMQSGNPTSWYSSGNTLTIYMNVGQGATFLVTTTTSTCGTNSRLVTFYTNSSRMSYIVSPNPATTELTISAQQADAPVGSTITTSKDQPWGFEVELYDQFGQRVKTRTNVGHLSSIPLDLRGLRAGKYILRITDDQRSLGQQILIEK